MKLVLLGTGTPIPDPDASGPASAVVVNGQAYLFDAGPGVVRRAEAAAEKLGIPALSPTSLTILFLTHLHSDHTLGYPDLIFTPWVIGRSQPLLVYGPKGTLAMTDHLKQAYSADIAVRTEGFEGLASGGPRVDVHEMTPEGVYPREVYRDANVRVTAIPVRHGSWAQSFGYLVEGKESKIVISGDTAPCPALAEACDGCDILLHEVYSAARFANLPPSAKRYHSSFHTSTKELAELAARAKPKLLVLYHQLYFGPKEGVDLAGEIRNIYPGKVENGQDLTAY